MNKYKYFFKESTNRKLSDGVCRVLAWDCHNFGFYKNNKPNFSGLLNRLIPELSKYRDDLHEKFLWFNNNNENITRQIEDNIYNVYVKTFDIADSCFINVPFRISKNYTKDFAIIYEQKLKKYGLDFTNYIRTLLCEYAIKPYYQRELFFFYSFVENLKEQIKSSRLCYYVNCNKQEYFIPVAIEMNAKFENYIVGIKQDFLSSIFVPLRQAENVRFLTTVECLRDNDYDLISREWQEFSNKEIE